MIRSGVRVWLAWCAAMPSFAAGLELRYAALERLIAEQLFTEDGRRYVRGNRGARCQYAYLEAPHLGAVNGRLRVTAKFSGRSAVDVLGRCMGLGDSFDLTLTATPVVRSGALALDKVEVTTLKDSYYIRRVRGSLAASFGRDFKIDVRDQAKKLVEQPRESATVKQELKDFEVSGVSLTEDSLVLEVEFKLVVK
jgi:hypothetical protein